MPYGHNVATCSKCHRPYITGDCIELDGICGECETPIFDYEEKLDILQAAINKIRQKQKEKMKADISKIMVGALSGQDKDLRTDDGFVRWGLVEKRIHAVIDKSFDKETSDDKDIS